MTENLERIRQVLSTVRLPDGGDLISSDLVRALSFRDGQVRFVMEAENPKVARELEAVRKEAERKVGEMPDVRNVSVVLTAHGPDASGKAPGKVSEPPNLRIGRHPSPQNQRMELSGVDRIVAVASGKGGVGKSTVASNLAVALTKQGRRVGLLDADIHGPSLPKMMGISQRPGSPDGKTIIPVTAHGVTTMSIGLMVDPGQAVIWRGPMLMGALQQMLGQVKWGRLDILVIDLPPGTGDVQLTLCQRTVLTGALVVSTPQDVALLDARKAIDMFAKLSAPVLGLIENMSTYVCPQCGNEEHIFGHGGVRAEAETLGIPFLGELPLALEVRAAGDSGIPAAVGEGPVADAYRALATRLIEDGVA